MPCPHKKDVHTLTPRICEYVISHGKKDFEGRIQIKILRRKSIPDFQDGSNVVTEVHLRERLSDRDDVRTPAEVREEEKMLCCWL